MQVSNSQNLHMSIASCGTKCISEKWKRGPYSSKSQGEQYLQRCSDGGNCIQGGLLTGPPLFSTKMKKASEPTRGSLG